MYEWSTEKEIKTEILIWQEAAIILFKHFTEMELSHQTSRLLKVTRGLRPRTLALQTAERLSARSWACAQSWCLERGQDQLSLPQQRLRRTNTVLGLLAACWEADRRLESCQNKNAHFNIRYKRTEKSPFQLPLQTPALNWWVHASSPFLFWLVIVKACHDTWFIPRYCKKRFP